MASVRKKRVRVRKPGYWRTWKQNSRNWLEIEKLRKPPKCDRSLLWVALTNMGGLRATARACGVSPTAVEGWVRRGSVPSKHIDTVMALGNVSRHALRPDLFGPNTESGRQPWLLTLEERVRQASVLSQRS